MRDTSDVPETDFKPIKAGWYELILESYEDKESKKGDSYTKLTFNIEGEPGKAWGNLSDVDQALWKQKQFKTAIGMDDSSTNLEPYVGSRLEGWCKNREYEGKNYTEVTEYRPLGDSKSSSQTAKPKDDDLPF